MDRAEALQLINTLIEEADAVGRDTNLFDAWRRKCKTVLNRIFGEECSQFQDLIGVNFNFYGVSNLGDNTPHIGDFRNGLQKSKEVLRSCIWEIEQFGMSVAASSGDVGQACRIVERICNRFHAVARQLRHRRTDRPTPDVTDEYDVQDLGRRMVNRYNIVYRCSACGNVESDPLPRFPKKIIYLDQCAISSIVKAKDAFWTDLHKNLKNLIGLQLIACPYSSLHREESMLSEEWRDDLQTLYKELAVEDRFRSPDDIEFTQLCRALRAYIGHPESSDDAEFWKDFCEKDPHRFTGDMVVYCHFDPHPQIVSSVQQRKDRTHEGMEKVADYWKQNPQSFKEAVAAEIEGYGRGMMDVYRKQGEDLKDIEEMLSGELLDIFRSTVRPGEFNPNTPPADAPAVRLVHHLACEVLKHRPDEHNPVSVVEEFFRSEQAKQAPFLDISSRLRATIAQQTQSDKKPRNPKPSDNYDVKAVSTYAPYCDAMFLDNEFRNLAEQGNIDVPGRYNVRLFSANNRDDFADYLQDILVTGISSEHRERLALVYPEWAPAVRQQPE